MKLLQRQGGTDVLFRVLQMLDVASIVAFSAVSLANWALGS